MNISKETIQALNDLGYTVHFQDEFLNEKIPSLASEMYIGWQRLNKEDIVYIGKTIKATKKETTVDYILNKINSDKTFANFSLEFNKLISKEGFSAYPTTYGIGVFVAVGFRNSISEAKNKIENTLNNLGIKYVTEYSDAGWVFRYKISKCAENIQTLKKVLL